MYTRWTPLPAAIREICNLVNYTPSQGEFILSSFVLFALFAQRGLGEPRIFQDTWIFPRSKHLSEDANDIIESLPSVAVFAPRELVCTPKNAVLNDIFDFLLSLG
ncbi:hypothetical protein TWF569_007879 [Orbilia oligospora]|uniref:Uncharacterized protein n=1 Tax=Orbilia oligospora TaxID=2813651 RepID=A0A7C8JGJ6_ORBOL|nr:hypothetical protein TWF102_000419 [Orbilia oligospora]KAF3113882.1 hypothetical protein TWF706_009247 [Orbilia oligospora]KAF3115868.1 hypothetical protein TWF103_010106 [Orbilia oligospora]KAF3149570.1 hypothetical protein TWF594_010677 [Orbilia oligospora]KAF3155832.1 hypothetical protein TWF569_007879 [Orbilia oligospora]